MKVLVHTKEEFSKCPFQAVIFDGSLDVAKFVFYTIERSRGPDDNLEYWHSDDNGGCIVIRLDGIETVVNAGEVATIVRH